MRKGKILFPWFLKCEKKAELSGHEAKKKTLIVIFNLCGDCKPSKDTYPALSTRTWPEQNLLRCKERGKGCLG